MPDPTSVPPLYATDPRLEQTDEGVWLVFGDGKYPHDPPRPASAMEIRLWEALHDSYERFATVWSAVAHHAQVLDDRALGHPDYVLLDRDDIDNHLYNAVRDFDPEMWDERVPGLGRTA